MSAFAPIPFLTNRVSTTTSVTLAAKKKSGKGFGAATKEGVSKKVVDVSELSVQAERSVQLAEPVAAVKTAGQMALERLREQERAQKDEELRKVKEMRNTDGLVSENPDAAVIPEKVAQRMTKRMLPFVGIPLFGVMGTFIAFWYLRVYKDLVFETSLVAFTTIAVLVLSLLGITYSVISASWDEDREGSVLGFDEFQNNVQSIKDGLGRSRENAVLRDRMAGLSENEIEAALGDLERRDKKKEKKTKSLQQKLEDEGL